MSDPTGASVPLRADYRERLDAVDDELIGSALLVAEAFPAIVRRLVAGDTAGTAEAVALAARVRASCRQVEDHGFLLLAREAPVSGDLRRLVSILRLVDHLDRAASLVRHVSHTGELLAVDRLPPDVRAQVERLGAAGVDVFHRGIEAWRQRDALAVNDLELADVAVDRQRTQLLVRACALEGDPSAVLQLGLLARYLERLGDHGVAFAQHTTFAVTGERVGAAG